MRRYNKPASALASRSNATPVNENLTLLRSFDSDAHRNRPVRPSPLASSTIAGMPLDLLDRLRSFPLFASAPEQFLYEIAQHLRPQLLAQNEEIIREGEQGRSMWWVVRGSVRVTSRDGESTYAELRSGTFFGEIGILMGMPRTASVIATVKTLVVRLGKEDLESVLRKGEFESVRQQIVEEAEERLRILQKKKKELVERREERRTGVAKRARESSGGEDTIMQDGAPQATPVAAAATTGKKRKSPSPGLAEAAASSALGSGGFNVRQTLKELPLFTGLPPEILHFLGLNAQPMTFLPFTEIIKQDSQGRDVYFIIKGEVEVIQEGGNKLQANGITTPTKDRDKELGEVKARLKAGQYFGEVTSLSLAPRRTATVRTVDAVECLMVSGSVLDELWRKCSPDVRRQVEATARERLEQAASAQKDGKDTVMLDITPTTLSATHALDELVISPSKSKRNSANIPNLQVSADPAMKRLSWETGPPAGLSFSPHDPDPFLNAELDNIRARSRRGSLAPPGSQTAMQPVSPDTNLTRSRRGSLAPPTNGNLLDSPSPQKPHPPPLLLQAIGRLGNNDPKVWNTGSPPGSPKIFKRPKISRQASRYGKGRLPDPILTRTFRFLDLLTLMKLRAVSVHWNNLINNSPDVLEVLDLGSHNRLITDAVVVDRIVPFIESRKGRGGLKIREVNIDNCFHMSDEGFLALAKAAGTMPGTSTTASPTSARSVSNQPSQLLTVFSQNHTGLFSPTNKQTPQVEHVSPIRVWRMRSCWDITGAAILAMIEMNKGLQYVDLSNCRKVGDNLLARVVGWIVPDLPPHLTTPAITSPNGVTTRRAAQNGPQSPNGTQQQQNRGIGAPGSVVGLPNLNSLTLSYCKHITDRSMAHIAAHMSKRLETLDLTRCTSISDQGFAHWALHDFPKLRKLCLRDCTYLSDRAIVGICQGLGKGMSGMGMGMSMGGQGLGGKPEGMFGMGMGAGAEKGGLRELDLSFCCALSDTSTDLLSLSLPSLTWLSLSFCGSAVSDSSLRSIGLHLLELEYLSVRGCVRVTGNGVESVLEGCTKLKTVDVSQCKNLAPWVDGGGVERWADVEFILRS